MKAVILREMYDLSWSESWSRSGSRSRYYVNGRQSGKTGISIMAAELDLQIDKLAGDKLV